MSTHVRDTCNVCAESFTNVLRKPIKCSSCEYLACRSCMETYMSNSSLDYQCMNCNRLMDDDFIKSELTHAGVKRLQKHRENVLFERQRAMCPQTQHYVKRAINMETRDIKRTQLSQTQRVYHALRDVIQFCKNNEFKLNTYTEETLGGMMNLQKNIHDNLSSLKTDVRRINTELQNNDSTVRTKTNSKIQFSLPCPREDCKGFVTADNKWQCGICDCALCKHCHMETSEYHECKQEDVDSATLIKQSTRSCPSCSTLIHKIEGCNQMWCTQCNTAFCYRTGQRFTRNIHNPHYFDWLNRNAHINVNDPQNTQPLLCNENIAQYRLVNHINTVLKNDDVRKCVLEEVRLKYHALADGNRYQRDEYNPEVENRTQRVNWMRGLINDTKFKRFVQSREKRWNVDTRLYQVYDMYNNMSNEIILKIIKEVNKENMLGLYKELFELRKYTNSCFGRVGAIYSIRPPRL